MGSIEYAADILSLTLAHQRGVRDDEIKPVGTCLHLLKGFAHAFIPAHIHHDDIEHIGITPGQLLKQVVIGQKFTGEDMIAAP